MATPITGAISLSQVNTELGLSSTATISFNDTLYRQLTNQLSGTADLSNARAAASVNSTVTNLNVYSTLFSSSGVSTAYKVLVRSGVTVGATSGNNALVIGQFPSGSSIVINNYGGIDAHGGAGGSGGAGSPGGDAIFANYSNQTVTINNQSGAAIRGGGGGGGRGGQGGPGSNLVYQPYNSSNRWEQTSGAPNPGNFGRKVRAYFNGALVYNQDFCPNGTGLGNPTGGYYRGSYQGYRTVGDCGDGEDPESFYVIGANQSTTGGAGGAGGRGQGYDGGAANGSAGAAGGTNAGTGGTGGTGGSYGNSGATGNTGASGNAGGGSAGSGGGASGRYLVRGASSVTLNNSGTVAGGLA
jgi:hypothetical protein